jgi:signal transduction histidine kinase
MFDDNAVVVEVQDTGRGIEKEQLEHIFDPYRRKKLEGEDLSGLGVGLALSKMYVDLHKGQFWVESTPGRGSIFRFTIPVVKEAIDYLFDEEESNNN